MTRRYYMAGAALIVAVLAVTAVAYPHLPDTVPVHWDSKGNVNGWGGKWTLLTIDPGLMTGILLLFASLSWLSPRHYEVDSSVPRTSTSWWWFWRRWRTRTFFSSR